MKRKPLSLFVFLLIFEVGLGQTFNLESDGCNVEYPTDPGEPYLGDLKSRIFAADFPVISGQMTIEYLKLYLKNEVTKIEIAVFTDDQGHPFEMHLTPITITDFTLTSSGNIYEADIDLTPYNWVLDGGYSGANFWLTVTTPDETNFWVIADEIYNNTNFFSTSEYYGNWMDLEDFGLVHDGAFEIYASCSDTDSYVISVNANPEEGGTVTGGGNYSYGEPVTVSAIPNPGYEFIHWTEDGEHVSNEASYNFELTNSRELTANFVYYGPNYCEQEYPLNENGNGIGNMADVIVAADFLVEPGGMNVNIIQLFTHFPVENLTLSILNDNNRTPGEPAFGPFSITPLYQYPWTQGPPLGDRQIVYLDLSALNINLDGGEFDKYYWLSLISPGDENYWSSALEVYNGTNFFTYNDFDGIWIDLGQFNNFLDGSFTVYSECDELKLTDVTDSNTIVYPNPYRDLLTIRTENDPILKIEIFDLSGKQLLQKEGNGLSELNINEDLLPKGIYILRTHTEKKIENFRLIKN